MSIKSPLLVLLGFGLGVLFAYSKSVTHFFQSGSPTPRRPVVTESPPTAPATVNAVGTATPEAKLPENSVDPQLFSLPDGNNQFACDAYGVLRKQADGNLAFSPYSIRMGLAMVLAGASGETASQIARALHLADREPVSHPAMAQLNTAVVADLGPSCQFRVANRLWGQKGYEFLPAYLETTRKHYGAEPVSVDFASHGEEAAHQMNAWVEEQTAQRIKGLIGPSSLGPLTRLVLTNTVYFKASWEKRFSTAMTQEMPFHVTPGKTVQARFMTQTETFRLWGFWECSVLEMRYRDCNLSMLILLPDQKEGLPFVERRLARGELPWRAKQIDRSSEVIVYLPRFRMTTKLNLNGMLEWLGMTTAFAARSADFSRMSRRKELFLSEVAHQTFIDVDETGTEAAAATISQCPAAAPGEPPKPRIFRADHPFIFLIRDNRTQTIVFMGRVTNPLE